MQLFSPKIRVTKLKVTENSGIPQLASQLDALKSQLLKQAAHLPTYDDDNGDKDSTTTTDDDETDSNEGCSRKDPDGGNPSVSPN